LLDPARGVTVRLGTAANDRATTFDRATPAPPIDQAEVVAALH
jgi:hypothetical protein